MKTTEKIKGVTGKRLFTGRFQEKGAARDFPDGQNGQRLGTETCGRDLIVGEWLTGCGIDDREQGPVIVQGLREVALALQRSRNR